MFECFGKHGINTLSGCSYHGHCEKPNVCSCFENNGAMYIGEQCEEWGCYKKGKSDELVCAGKGICVQPNQCDCSVVNQYGRECQENIGDKALYYLDQKEVRIKYVVPLSIVEKLDNFKKKCNELAGLYEEDSESLRRKKGKSIFGEESECTFSVPEESEFSDYIVISLGGDHTVEDGVRIYIKPLTDENETIVIEIEEFGLTDRINREKDKQTNIIVGTILGILIPLFCVCGVIAIVVIVTTVVAYLRKRKIAEKVKELENLDILLEEQKLERNDSIAHMKINKKMFVVDHTDLKLLKIIGQGGGDATIYKALWKKRVVAYKMFRISDLAQQIQPKRDSKSGEGQSSYSFENFEKEEYCENGDLREYFSLQENVPIGEKLRFSLQIAEGCEYLHDRSIIHRDLKPQNVLLDSNVNCKICDFGLSKILSEQKNLTTRVGTSYYIAPEVWRSNKYDNSVDVFSFSILFYQIVVGDFQNPFPGEETQIEFRIAQDPTFRPSIEKIEVLNTGVETKWICEILPSLWGEPNERMNFKEIVEAIHKNYKINCEKSVDSLTNISTDEMMRKELADAKLEITRLNGIIEDLEKGK